MTTHEQDEFDAKVAAILANRVANIRTTTEEQDRSVGQQGPIHHLGPSCAGGGLAVVRTRLTRPGDHLRCVRMAGGMSWRLTGWSLPLISTIN